MDYDLIVVKTLERVYKNYYYIIRGVIMGVIRNKKAFLAFLLPGLLFYILAVFYPIEESIRLSFMKWGGIGKKQFVGLQNM